MQKEALCCLTWPQFFCTTRCQTLYYKSKNALTLANSFWQKNDHLPFFYLQETSFASANVVTRSLSSVTNNNKSKLPLPTSNGNSNTSNGNNSNIVTNQNRINTKKTDLERISPWLVSSDAITTKKEKEKSKIPQLKTVITTELWIVFWISFVLLWFSFPKTKINLLLLHFPSLLVIFSWKQRLFE